MSSSGNYGKNLTRRNITQLEFSVLGGKPKASMFKLPRDLSSTVVKNPSFPPYVSVGQRSSIYSESQLSHELGVNQVSLVQILS